MNDEYAVFAVSGLGVQFMARFNLVTQTWVDHDPNVGGIQNIDLAAYAVPVAMEVAPDGSFAVMCGLGAGSAGWAARVDLLDPSASPNYLITPYLAGMGLLAGAYGASLSRDGTMAAFTSTTPAKLIIVNAATGALHREHPAARRVEHLHGDLAVRPGAQTVSSRRLDRLLGRRRPHPTCAMRRSGSPVRRSPRLGRSGTAPAMPGRRPNGHPYLRMPGVVRWERRASRVGCIGGCCMSTM